MEHGNVRAQPPLTAKHPIGLVGGVTTVSPTNDLDPRRNCDQSNVEKKKESTYMVKDMIKDMIPKLIHEFEHEGKYPKQFYQCHYSCQFKKYSTPRHLDSFSPSQGN